MKISKAIVSTMNYRYLSDCLRQSAKKKQSEMDKTPEAYSMLNVLEKLPQHKKFMFGHHDDPVYGIGWDGDENRSDVKSVCGDYPAMMSFDLEEWRSTVIKHWIMYHSTVSERKLLLSMSVGVCHLSAGT